MRSAKEGRGIDGPTNFRRLGSSPKTEGFWHDALGSESVFHRLGYEGKKKLALLGRMVQFKFTVSIPKWIAVTFADPKAAMKFSAKLL